MRLALAAAGLTPLEIERIHAHADLHAQAESIAEADRRAMTSIRP